VCFKLQYITLKDELYEHAVAIRKALFFENNNNSSALINDAFEADAIHLICLKEHHVVGTGRLNINKNEGIISQMAVHVNYQGNGVGSIVLKELLKKGEAHGVSKIILSARDTAINFYGKFNFIPIGDKYPSIKTGIIHQKMEFHY